MEIGERCTEWLSHRSVQQCTAERVSERERDANKGKPNYNSIPVSIFNFHSILPLLPYFSFSFSFFFVSFLSFARYSIASFAHSFCSFRLLMTWLPFVFRLNLSQWLCCLVGANDFVWDWCRRAREEGKTISKTNVSPCISRSINGARHWILCRVKFACHARPFPNEIKGEAKRNGRGRKKNSKCEKRLMRCAIGKYSDIIWKRRDTPTLRNAGMCSKYG